MTRFVAVVGTKQSEKTTIIKNVVSILNNRGYHVATIKELSCTQTNDGPAEPTTGVWKKDETGAETVVVLPQNETGLFLKRRLSLTEIVPFLKNMDYVLLEGFEHEQVFAKIIAANTKEDFESFSDGLAIAVSGKIAESCSEIVQEGLKIPVFNALEDIDKIADVIEQKTFPILPNLAGCATCHSVGECGYLTCYEYAKAIVSGKSETIGCPLDLKDNVVVEVNGVKLPLKNFPETIIQNSLLGMFSSLHGVEKIQTLKIEINNRKLS
ncbi:MAG: molybdopterin-guanine dinucleotide biosynthesis protein MobB [Candidatus Bathyarchaeota archaeon]|nr:molybdopterin-guanine dinucleotide biosynthesis protein MobB [Candidatus Bathyarchaeum tardum]WGM89404.1 MAG: molybdopterin-guanine dinucleotide biosynthesis protein MobB [Candidatus Bathyarchaeum tardum]